MILLIIYVLFSFIIEGFMSNIFTSTLTNISYFTTIYTIISFVIIYPYFYNKKKYYILLVILGILFDMLYTSTFIVNVFIFLVIGFVIYLLNNIPSKCTKCLFLFIFTYKEKCIRPSGRSHKKALYKPHDLYRTLSCG